MNIAPDIYDRLTERLPDDKDFLCSCNRAGALHTDQSTLIRRLPPRVQLMLVHGRVGSARFDERDDIIDHLDDAVLSRHVEARSTVRRERLLLSVLSPGLADGRIGNERGRRVDRF